MSINLLTIGLAILAAVAVVSVKAQKADGGKLPTRWSKEVSLANPLPEYPRPQMTRKEWLSLNGSWDYAFAPHSNPHPPARFSGKILVPFPMESALSGVQKKSAPNERIWYRRTFAIPPSWKGQRVLLHFGAVNWDSTVAVNGRQFSPHRGGYDSFSWDITTELNGGVNEIVVSAWNPLLADDPADQVLGKQRKNPSGIFYTAATGIWQTVWLEPVPGQSIKSLKITPDIDSKSVHIVVLDDGEINGTDVSISVMEGAKEVARKEGNSNETFHIPIPSPILWTPETPHLYNLKVNLTHNGKKLDAVDSYFAMRKISLGKDEKGQNRIFLNNQFVFQVGALDQGYWPDGIYTAPTDSALKFDIEAAKRFGFNLLRKHAKVEPERWYYWTDKLGMLVWQDMPQGFSGEGGKISDEGKAQFKVELHRLIESLYNHGSIIVWTTFNEGWGQHDSKEIADLAKSLDPSRLINSASGWNDEHAGDIADTHAYPGPWAGKPEENRASVNGEFGGVTMRVPGHMWTEDVFGYGATLKEKRLVTSRYQQLLRKAYDLRDSQGASAVVYTQLTDVEQESNGLLTYDRKIIKADEAVVKNANLGVFPALPPNPNPDVLPTSQENPQTWQYATEKPAENWTAPDFDSSAWKSGLAGFGNSVGSVRTPWTTPDIWLRREVTLPAKLKSKLEFEVFYDEDVEIYINGVLAGSAKGYVTDYVSLPMTPAGRTALKPGKNIIAVHCHQTIGGQYIDVGIK